MRVFMYVLPTGAANQDDTQRPTNGAKGEAADSGQGVVYLYRANSDGQLNDS